MSIFYIPKKQETGTMWDTWVYWYEGSYYLYYLAKSGPKWDNISLAISTDGLQWNEIGPILRMGKDVTWMGTGSVWKSPASVRRAQFQINYSEWKGPRQTIFFADSDDLVHWKKRGDEVEFVQDERWYEPEGRWDCIWTIPRPKGGMYGYWTATPKFGTGGRFGLGQTLDGIRWEALPPPKVYGVNGGEVGAIEKIGDRYYMMFGAQGCMTTLVADSPSGPFHVAEKNRTLLGSLKRWTYFSRFFPTPDGLLVNHHSIAPEDRIYLGLLKRAVVDDESTMRLSWWEGNDRLKRDRTEVEVPLAGDEQTHVRMLDPMDATDGVIVEGEIFLPPDHFAPRRGLYIEHEIGHGLAVLFDAQGRAELSLMKENATACRVQARVDREVTYGSPAGWRLVLEGCLAELYLDDILIECFSLPACATGRIGLIDGGKPDAIRGLRKWQ